MRLARLAAALVAPVVALAVAGPATAHEYERSRDHASTTSVSMASGAIVSPAGIRAPQLAVGGRGTTVVAWERLRRRPFAIDVQARIGRAPDRLGPVLEFNGQRPLVAAGADGTAAISWRESGRPPLVAIARRGRGLGRPRRLRGMGLLALAVQPNGRVVAVGLGGKGDSPDTRILRVAMARRGRRFGRSRAVGSVNYQHAVSMAVDPRDGAVVLVYRTPFNRESGGGGGAAARALPQTAASFSPPTVVSGSEAHPVAVSGPGGAGIAFLESYPMGGATLRLARRAGGSWGSAERITAPPWAPASPPACAQMAGYTATLPADGFAVAAWGVLTESNCGGPFGDQEYREDRRAFASIAAPNSPFGSRLSLTPPAANFGSPVAAAAGDEAFVAAAVHNGGRVWLARRAPGATSFGKPRTLTRNGDGDVLLAAGGPRVLVAYQRNDRLRLKIVR
jgi:hypothetical protein